MIRHGQAPYLECSSKGDKRFSAFCARIRSHGNRTIEEIYQAAKIFEDGSTGLSWREAKGRKAVNQDSVSKLYSSLWEAYIVENPELLNVLKRASGVSDIFGQTGHCCQATELWRIRQVAIEFEEKFSDAMEFFEERVAVMHYDGELSQEDASIAALDEINKLYGAKIEKLINRRQNASTRNRSMRPA